MHDGQAADSVPSRFFRLVAEAGGGRTARGEMVAEGQRCPGELLPPDPWITAWGEPRRVSPPPPEHLGLSRLSPQGSPWHKARPAAEARPLSPPGWLRAAAYAWFSSGSACPILPGGRGPSSRLHGSHSGAEGPLFPSNPAGTGRLLGNEL